MLPFGDAYAAAYDALYGDKDYANEIDLLEKRWGRTPTSVIDLGCGTGSHALLLAQRGLRVCAVDRSAAMLEIARAKCAGTDVTFVQQDLAELDLPETYDAALMMFAVLGYQHEPGALRETLRRVRRHLKPGGVFLFDVWFGPAVLALRPGTKVKAVGELTRTATASLDLLRQTVDVGYTLERGGARVEERHVMRFFFPRELELLLSDAGMELSAIEAFPSGAAPSEESWNVLVTARAV